MSSDPVLLAVRHLSVSYGTLQAVQDVDLDVRTGEIVALLGANGAGKSTTMKAICRMVPLRGGEILLAGRSLQTVPSRALARLGMTLVPERRRLFPGLTVTENLEMGAFGRPRAEVRRGIDEVLELFSELKRHVQSLASTLSGGEQQMLAIGRGLMSRPRLLLLDEPFLGLAPMLIDTMVEKLKQFHRDGTAILLAEQNVWTILEMADRGYVMASGRVVMSGSAAALAKDERIRQAYLGSRVSIP